MTLLGPNVLICGFDPGSSMHSWAADVIRSSLLGLPLATADTGRYQAYFPEVRLLTPGTRTTAGD